MKHLLIALFSLFLVASCTKTQEELPTTSKTEVDNSRECHYVPHACQVNGKMGIMCRRAYGNGCRKASGCVAVNYDDAESKAQFLSNIDTYAREYVNQMQVDGLIDAENWQQSFDLCKAILTERANSM